MGDITIRWENVRYPERRATDDTRVVELTLTVVTPGAYDRFGNRVREPLSNAQVIEMVRRQFGQVQQMPRWLRVVEVDDIYDDGEEESDGDDGAPTDQAA